MILYLLDSKVAIDLTNYKGLFYANRVYVVKIRRYYFLGFVLNQYPSLNKKIIKLKNINVVENLRIPFLTKILNSFQEILTSIDAKQPFVYRYFYLGLEKIIKTFLKYENILKIFVKSVLPEGLKIKNSKDYEIKYFENNYLENEGCIVLKIRNFKADKIKKILKYFRRLLRKRIKYTEDYHLSLDSSFIERFFMNFYGKNLILIYDLERVYKEGKIESFQANFWKDYVLNFTNSEDFIFPLWGIILHQFFERITIDYFPNFFYLFSFFKKIKKKVILNSFIDILNNSVKNEAVKVFRELKEKLIFENFSIKNLKDFLSNLKELNSEDFQILFFSFYKGFYRIYCDYCKNVPYCEVCNQYLKVYPKNLEKIEEVRLYCPKCKLKYDIFHCQYCGKFQWKIWKRDYIQELEDFKINYIRFLPSDFSFYLDKNKEFLVIVDYFSLYKPFVLKELNIWYILGKLISQLKIRNIILMNADEFNIFEYFSQFFENEDFIIEKLRGLINFEKAMID